MLDNFAKEFWINHWVELKQGRIHGNPVADGWAGAVMQKPLGIQKCDGRTDGPTYRPTDLPTDTARCRVACPRLKSKKALTIKSLWFIANHELEKGIMSSNRVKVIGRSSFNDELKDHVISRSFKKTREKKKARVHLTTSHVHTRFPAMWHRIRITTRLTLSFSLWWLSLTSTFIFITHNGLSSN